MDIKTEIDNEDTLLSSADDDWEKLLKQAETIKSVKSHKESISLDNLNWDKLLGSIYSKEKGALKNWRNITKKLFNENTNILESTENTIEEVEEIPDYIPRNYEDIELCRFNLNDSYHGYIVSSSNAYDSSRFNFAPSIYLSNTLYDPTFIGIISYTKKDTKHFKDSGIVIASTGQTSMWVCDAHLPILNGDLITTCIIPGIGIKQGDEIVKNYTVAKATMSCDFNPKEIPKKKFPPTLFDEFGRPIYFYEGELEPSYEMKYVNIKGTEISEQEYLDSENNGFRVAKICVKL